MSNMTRAEIVELYIKYRERVQKDPKTSKYLGQLDAIDRHIQASTGKPSVELRDYGRLLKTYLPELTGKLGLVTAHGHFVVAVHLYETGKDVQQALKRARTVFETKRDTLPAAIRGVGL